MFSPESKTNSFDLFDFLLANLMITTLVYSYMHTVTDIFYGHFIVDLQE